MPEISQGDAVLIEGGTRHEGEEGRVLGFHGDCADIDIFGDPGKTRTIPIKYLVDSPFTENDDWSNPPDKSSDDDFKQYQPSVPDELEGFEMDDRVKVIDCNDERFIGATGSVIDAEKINGDWSIMVFLEMPWDRERDFEPSNLKNL
jgi:hypothetical protein